jgi:DNA-binding NarL/FixJ family response regulator
MENILLNNRNENGEYQKVLIINQGTAYIKKLSKLIAEKTLAHVLGHASNLKEGYRMFVDSNPDWIFISTNLPDGNWVKALAHLKNIKPDLKVILISDPLDRFTNRELKEAKIDFCLDKSMDLEKVPGIINKMVKLN